MQLDLLLVSGLETESVGVCARGVGNVSLLVAMWLRRGCDTRRNLSTLVASVEMLKETHDEDQLNLRGSRVEVDQWMEIKNEDEQGVSKYICFVQATCT